MTPSTLDFAGKLAFVHGVISILSATPTDCLNKKYACQFVFPRFSIFISTRILVSTTKSRLWLLDPSFSTGDSVWSLCSPWGRTAHLLTLTHTHAHTHTYTYTHTHNTQTQYTPTQRYLRLPGPFSTGDGVGEVGKVLLQVELLCGQHIPFTDTHTRYTDTQRYLRLPGPFSTGDGVGEVGKVLLQVELLCGQHTLFLLIIVTALSFIFRCNTGQ